MELHASISNTLILVIVILIIFYEIINALISE
jgi:hypothetical protein